MRIGFDFWQVVSHYPHFIDMAEGYRMAGFEIHIVSGVGAKRKGTVYDEARALDFPFDEVHEVVFKHPRESPELKLKKCKELGIVVFFDDRADVCRLLNENGILAMLVPRKDGSKYDLGGERDQEENNNKEEK